MNAGMDDDAPNEAFADLKTRPLGGWGVAQIAAGTGLAVYAMWVGICQPGFRKVPLKLQVPKSLKHLIIYSSCTKRFEEIILIYCKLFKTFPRSHIFLPARLKWTM